MTEPITIEITDMEIMELPLLGMVETFVVNKLKKAGIPVNGLLLFGGVKSGILVSNKDYEKMSTVYTWVEA